MRRISTVLVLVSVLCACAFASEKSQDPLEKAREHAAHVSDKKQAKADVELVRALVDRAGELYNAQKFEESAKALDEARDTLTLARASAEEHQHDIKQCDLILDHVEYRLKDYSNSFATADRPRVNALLKQVQAMRDELLKILFETK